MKQLFKIWRTTPQLIPTNRKQQAIWYLLEWDDYFTSNDIIKHSEFNKWRTRMSEIQEVHGTIMTNQTRKFVDRFGFKNHCQEYKRSVSKERLIEIFNLYK